MNNLALKQRSIDRNLSETIQAIREHRTLSEIEMYNTRYAIRGFNFFSVSYFALFNSMMGHVAKVLDGDKNSATFWFVCKEYRAEVEVLKVFSEEKIKFLENLKARIKHVRDKTLFHIDLKAVMNPAKVWEEVSIKSDELKLALEYSYDLLYELCDDAFKSSKFGRTDYNCSHIKELLEYARQNELCIFVDENNSLTCK